MGNINFFCHLSGGSEKISGETKGGGEGRKTFGDSNENIPDPAPPPNLPPPQLPPYNNDSSLIKL